MLLTESEVDDRLSSPLNLINRMRQATDSRNPTSPTKALELFMPPKVEDIIVDAEDKIKLGLAHKGSIDVMGKSIEMIRERLHEVEKVKDLSRIAVEMSRVNAEISEIRGGGKGLNQLVIYQPMIVQENYYETVRVNE